jgi:hypothetical protein
MTETVPAGKHYLGDPCYSFDKSWSQVLDDSEFFEKPYKKYGLTAVGFGTAYGDGEYSDQFGNKYPVDAGMIGLVQVGLEDRTPDGVLVVEFSEETKCYSEGGTLHFGEYVIKTGDDEYEEED